MTPRLDLTPLQKLERRRAREASQRKQEAPDAKAARLARKRANDAARRQRELPEAKAARLAKRRKLYDKAPPKVKEPAIRALRSDSQRARDKRRAEELRKVRAAMPKHRNRSNCIEKNHKAYEDWKRDGYVPSAYVAPPPSDSVLFDKMWWASLSLKEQAKILSAATPLKASQYASESKRQFMDSNSAG